MSDIEQFQEVVLNSKLMKGIFSQFSELSNTINKLEQHMKNSLTEQRMAKKYDILDLNSKSSFEL